MHFSIITTHSQVTGSTRRRRRSSPASSPDAQTLQEQSDLTVALYHLIHLEGLPAHTNIYLEQRNKYNNGSNDRTSGRHGCSAGPPAARRPADGRPQTCRFVNHTVCVPSFSTSSSAGWVCFPCLSRVRTHTSQTCSHTRLQPTHTPEVFV